MLPGYLIGLVNIAQAQERSIDLPIHRAVTWLSIAIDKNWEPGIPAMIQYLHRRFPQAELGWALHQAKQNIKISELDQRRFPLPFLRLVDTEYQTTPEQIAGIGDLIGRTTASALHCDRIPLPNSYKKDLNHLSRSGGYALTHAVLAAQWSIENGCLDITDLSDFQNQAILRLSQLIEHQAGITDLAIEAAAMIFYAGASEKITKIWLNSLANAQQEDGGWTPGIMGLTESHPHTTYLALWVLLEARYPDAPKTLMIP